MDCRQHGADSGDLCGRRGDRMRMPEGQEIRKMCREIEKIREEQEQNPGFERLWREMEALAGEPFRTAKGLAFAYTVRGGELFFDRKEKSVTKATVKAAYRRALELEALGVKVTGPKKLGVFGASYLYPIFVRLGVIALPE